MSNEWEIKMSEARSRLPLRRMMMERGKEVSSTKKSFKCPYCGSDSASLFHPNGSNNEMFKCFSTKCPTATNAKGGAWDEVKFLAYELAIPERDAAIQYLKEAGVWRETERTAPSILPGSRARKNKRPEPPSATEAKPESPMTESPVESSTSAPQAEAGQSTKPADGVEPSAIGQPAESSAGSNPAGATPEQPISKADETSALPDKNVPPVEGLENAPERPPSGQPPAAFVPKVIDGDGQPRKPRDEDEDEKPEDEWLPGQRVLDAFYSRLTLLPEDEKILFIKRGSESRSSHILGFVSSPDSNREILNALEEAWPWEELEASGLFLPEDSRKQLARRPNSQFFGLGQKGKKPKDQRRDKNDRWEWGKTHPILIPYFNELGRIVKLRPHKGGAPANTLCGSSRIYVPRDFRHCADRGEYFRRVVITEGDFKAAALWQTIGAGRSVNVPTAPLPLGVCGIPGINFASNLELRAELDIWLRNVQCEEVVVVFDNEDKADKPLRDRHEAYIWARYLAADLARKLHIVGKVGILPNEWRDEKKKADWDGALARFIHEPENEPEQLANL